MTKKKNQFHYKARRRTHRCLELSRSPKPIYTRADIARQSDFELANEMFDKYRRQTNQDYNS